MNGEKQMGKSSEKIKWEIKKVNYGETIKGNTPIREKPPLSRNI